MKKRIQTVRHAIESLLRHTCLLAAVPGLLFLPGWIWASDSPYLPRHGVNLATGNKFYQQRDLLISGPHDFAFSRSYNSQSREAGIFGYGWTSTLSDHLEFEGSVAWRCQADGQRMRLVSQGSGLWVSAQGRQWRLERQETGGYILRSADRRTDWRFDEVGRLQERRDSGGYAVRLRYAEGRLTGMSDTLGRELALAYDGQGRVVRLITAVGEWHYGYDGAGNLQEARDPAGGVTRYLYEDARDVHNLTGVLDAAGVRTQSTSYSANDRVVTASLAENTDTISITYLPEYRRVISNALGVMTEYELEVRNQVARVKSYSGGLCASRCQEGLSGSYRHDNQLRLLSATDGKGVETRYSYDERGNRVSETRAFGTALARTTSYTYTAENQLATRSEPSGSNPGQQVETAYSYDGRGNLSGLSRRGYAGTEAIVETSSYSYDALGRLIRVDGPRGDVADVLSLEYYPDEAGEGYNRGQLRALVNALGQRTVFSDYGPSGKPGKIIDASGLETSLSYNFRGDVLSRSVGNLVTTYSYDGAGRLQSLSLPGGRRLSYSYSGGRLSSITDALGNAITYSYDGLGRQSARELRDPENRLRYSLRFAYDQAGNLAKRMYGDNSEEQFAYDPVANLVRAVDPLGVVSEYGYDGLRRRLTEKRAGEQIAGYGYDSQDNIIGVTDARSHVTTSVYDDFGRERQVASPDAGTNASVYDEAGNLLSRSNALGERAEFFWDALNRPVRLQWPGAARAVEFSWDQDTAGRLTGIQEEEFERRFGYDGLGRVTQERVSREGVSLSVGYGYDEATGELSSITYPSGTVLQYSYDAAGRISGLRFGEHDLARDIRYLPFGPVTGMRLGGVNLSRSYDQRYQASRIQAGDLDYVYTRNAAGQVTESKGLAVPAVESGSESYSIDAASNQLAVRGGTSYSYDAAGRLLSDGVRSFGWDALGRLKTVRRNGQELAGYGYDSQNRRVRKTVGAKTTYYLYDLESRLLAEIAGNGRVLREYVWLGQEPVALREYELRPGLYFYINDHLGTPQRLITGEGTVVWQAAALPFGRTQVQLGTVQNNLRFPGQYFDAETGLHYNWNRYYDPDTGRYLSPDPIGLEGGLNLYAYVENDPVNLVDPEGLCRKNGESRSACAERVAKEVLGDKLEILDDFGYWGLGTGALSATFGNSLFKKAVDKGADKFIKNSQIAGADTDGDMFAKKAASRKAAREAGKIASKRAALAAISKYSGILGLGATGGSGMMRALGYYFGECDKECQCE